MSNTKTFDLVSDESYESYEYIFPFDKLKKYPFNNPPFLITECKISVEGFAFNYTKCNLVVNKSENCTNIKGIIYPYDFFQKNVDIESKDKFYYNDFSSSESDNLSDYEDVEFLRDKLNINTPNNNNVSIHIPIIDGVYDDIIDKIHNDTIYEVSDDIIDEVSNDIIYEVSDDIIDESSTNDIIDESSADNIIDENSADNVIDESFADEIIDESFIDEIIDESSVDDIIDDDIIDESFIDEIIDESSVDDIIDDDIIDDDDDDVVVDDVDDDDVDDDVVVDDDFDDDDFDDDVVDDFDDDVVDDDDFNDDVNFVIDDIFFKDNDLKILTSRDITAENCSPEGTRKNSFSRRELRGTIFGTNNIFEDNIPGYDFLTDDIVSKDNNVVTDQIVSKNNNSEIKNVTLGINNSVINNIDVQTDCDTKIEKKSKVVLTLHNDYLNNSFGYYIQGQTYSILCDVSVMCYDYCQSLHDKNNDIIYIDYTYF